jgi:6-phosphogluconolactonase (cycloisomerase 2 family)
MIARLALAQSTGATFGNVIRLGGTPSDIVLDESRGRLYLVNSNTNQVNVYDYVNNNLVSSLYVGTTPVAAAISMDGHYLYVSNNASGIWLWSLPSQIFCERPTVDHTGDGSLQRRECSRRRRL